MKRFGMFASLVLVAGCGLTPFNDIPIGGSASFSQDKPVRWLLSVVGGSGKLVFDTAGGQITQVKLTDGLFVGSPNERFVESNGLATGGFSALTSWASADAVERQISFQFVLRGQPDSTYQGTMTMQSAGLPTVTQNIIVTPECSGINCVSNNP